MIHRGVEKHFAITLFARTVTILITLAIMIPSVWLHEMVFSGNTSIKFNQDDIVVIVGSNNVGKSAALRDIVNKLYSSSIESKVLKSLDYKIEGTLDEAKSFLLEIGRPAKSGIGYTANNSTLEAFGHKFELAGLKSVWNDEQSSGLKDFSRIFCSLLSAEHRLKITTVARSIAVTTDPLEHPTHWMIQDAKLEHEISEQFRKAFGVDLVLHRAAGDKLPIHVGLRPIVDPNEDRLDINYIKKIENLPLLEAQGDGMRGLAGILLTIKTGKESILLLDEPEAFLHPPQARYLGQVLSQEGRRGRQIFVATHSGDVLRGVLESKNSNVRIIRIDRNKELNFAYELAPNDIIKLWNDPLLRYSNILDGLFHEKVVICESDSDARFYSVIADTLFESSGSSLRRPDIMFTHCGGKHRIATIVKALKAVGVPTAIIADFDVLNDINPLKAIVEAANGEWKSIEQDWKSIKSAVDEKKADINIGQLKASLNDIASTITNQDSANKAAKEIGTKFKQSSPWSVAKSTGSASIPNGLATVAYGRMISRLKEVGIYVVEVGELESFVRSVGNHGPGWINGVLEKDLFNDPELDIAKNFVRQIINIPVKENISNELPRGEVVLTAAGKIKRGLMNDFARAPRKLAAIILAVSFILSYAQSQMYPLHLPESLSSASSRDREFYFLFSSLLLCYIISLGKRLAVYYVASLFATGLIWTFIVREYLLAQPVVLFSYTLFFLLQSYGFWLLYKKGLGR